MRCIASILILFIQLSAITHCQAKEPGSGLYFAPPVITHDFKRDKELPDGTLLICKGKAIVLSTTLQTGALYQWYKDGVPLQGQNNLFLVVRDKGNYSVERDYLGLKEFSNVIQVDVIPLPEGQLIEPAGRFICPETGLNLQATGGFSYVWYLDGSVISSQNAAQLVAKDPGLYRVELVSEEGCRKLSDQIVVLEKMRKPVVAASIEGYCQGFSSILESTSDLSGTGKVDVIWRFPNGMQKAGPLVSHTFTRPGKQSVRVVVNPVGCPSLADSIPFEVLVDSNYLPERLQDINVVNGRPMVIRARTLGDNPERFEYAWEPAKGLSSTQIQTPVHYPFGNQEYLITVKRPSGCVTTDTLLVRLFQDQAIYVAGGFTPNGDHVNDLAYPILVGTTELKYFKIFNRWGQLVFQTSSADAKKGWDGHFKGIAQPPGTYTWIAEAIGENNIPILESGVLNLIR